MHLLRLRNVGFDADPLLDLLQLFFHHDGGRITHDGVHLLQADRVQLLFGSGCAFKTFGFQLFDFHALVVVLGVQVATVRGNSILDLLDLLDGVGQKFLLNQLSLGRE